MDGLKTVFFSFPLYSSVNGIRKARVYNGTVPSSILFFRRLDSLFTMEEEEVWNGHTERASIYNLMPPPLSLASLASLSPSLSRLSLVSLNRHKCSPGKQKERKKEDFR